MKYKSRILDNIISEKLKGKGAILIEGPKWCGKTTTAQTISKSNLKLGEPVVFSQSKQIYDMDPSLLLKGATPRLIDEWQTLPKIWDAVRSEVDNRNEFGQFILTGSAVPAITQEILHTGTGRIARITMRTMSLYESEDSNGSIRLKDLFNNPKQIFAENNCDIEKLAFLTCRGGWPQSTFLKGNNALEQAYDYYNAIVNDDIKRADEIKRDPQRVKMLMRSYSRHIGQSVSYNTICADMQANDDNTLNDNTVASYINVLKKIYVIEDMPAWNPNLRSKTAIRTSDTRYYTDPSIGIATMGVGPQDLINDLNTFGLFFENMAIRDLRVYAQALNGEILHYRDKNGLECDSVIHLRDGNYALVEIKLGGEKSIEDGAKNLNALSAIIDTSKMPEPKFKMILIGVGKYAYKRPDGVFVVPLGCLRD